MYLFYIYKVNNSCSRILLLLLKMTKLRIPHLDSGPSIDYVRNKSDEKVFEVRKLPGRVIIVAEVDGEGAELYKITENSDDSTVSIVSMKRKKVVEKKVQK